MKKLLICFCLLAIEALQAQVSFGILAGIHTKDIGSGTIQVPASQLGDSLRITILDADYGFHTGVFLRLKKNSFYVQPEVQFNTIKSNYKLKSTNKLSQIDSFRSERFYNLDIPVMFGIKLSVLRINAGPVMHLQLNDNSDFSDLAGFKNNFSGSNYGYQLGIGFDFSKLRFDLRHEGNFTKYGDHLEFFNKKYNFSKNPTRLIASLSFKLF